MMKILIMSKILAMIKIQTIIKLLTLIMILTIIKFLTLIKIQTMIKILTMAMIKIWRILILSEYEVHQHMKTQVSSHKQLVGGVKWVTSLLLVKSSPGTDLKLMVDNVN